MTEPERSAEAANLQESGEKLKKNGRIYLLIFLATVPGLCYTSVKLHVIRIGAADTLRCEIDGLENGTWQSPEIKRISEALGAHKECFIYNYNYGTLTNMTFEDAKKFLDKQDVNGLKLCSKFVAIGNKENFTEIYTQEFASYCEGVSHEITLDIVAVLSSLLGCLILAPFADIYGRKRILSVVCDLVLFSVALKLFFFHFIQEQVGEMVLNFSYPAMKYSTQALVLETTISNALRPLAFALIFVGAYIPPLIAGVMPPVSVYWKCLRLIAFSPVLILPLLTWYFPESAVWLASIKEDKLAQIVAETVDDPRRQNEFLFYLRNKKGRFKEVKTLFQEFGKINRLEFILINVLAAFVGFLSFYSYSKHKLMYNYFQDNGIRFLNACSGLLAVLVVGPCLHLMNCVRFSMAFAFLGTGVLYLSLAHFYSNVVVPFPIVVVLISCIEIATNGLQILYEFYLQEIFPTSHRCLCTAYCGAAMNFGLLLVITTRHLNEIVSHIVTSTVCLIGCIITLLFVENLGRTNPLVLDFDNIEENPKKCLKACCKN